MAAGTLLVLFQAPGQLLEDGRHRRVAGHPLWSQGAHPRWLQSGLCFESPNNKLNNNKKLL